MRAICEKIKTKNIGNLHFLTKVPPDCWPGDKKSPILRESGRFYLIKKDLLINVISQSVFVVLEACAFMTLKIADGLTICHILTKVNPIARDCLADVEKLFRLVAARAVRLLFPKKNQM